MKLVTTVIGNKILKFFSKRKISINFFFSYNFYEKNSLDNEAEVHQKVLDINRPMLLVSLCNSREADHLLPTFHSRWFNYVKISEKKTEFLLQKAIT